MPSNQRISFNLGLPSTPESQDPRLFAELIKIYNAINILAQNIDGYTSNGDLVATVASKAPLTGAGTSGTWPISITGNAATVTGVTFAQVVAGLGFTPYSNANPVGYITAADASLALKANKTDNLSVFAATTSAQLAALLSDETGTGKAVFATGPALVSPTYLDGSIPNTSGANAIAVPDGYAFDVIVTAVQGGIGSSRWVVPCIKRGGTLAIGTIDKTVLSGEPIASIVVSAGNLSVTTVAANTYITYAVTRKVVLGA